MRIDALRVDIRLDPFALHVIAPGSHGIGKANMSHLDGLDRLVPMLLHQPNNAAWQDGQEFRDAGHDDVGDRMPLGGRRYLVGKHVHDHQRMRFGIGELLGHLVRRIKRVDVHKDATRL